jgi:hypothetical protein
VQILAISIRLYPGNLDNTQPSLLRWALSDSGRATRNAVRTVGLTISAMATGERGSEHLLVNQEDEWQDLIFQIENNYIHDVKLQRHANSKTMHMWTKY